MIFTVLSQTTPQQLQTTLKGESSGGIGGIVGTIFGFTVGILAVVINYRRNHSVLYAILAFLFSEFYLAYVLVGFLIMKAGL